MAPLAALQSLGYAVITGEMGHFVTFVNDGGLSTILVEHYILPDQQDCGCLDADGLRKREAVSDRPPRGPAFQRSSRPTKWNRHAHRIMWCSVV